MTTIVLANPPVATLALKAVTIATPKMIQKMVQLSMILATKRDTKMPSAIESINSAEREQLKEMHTSRESSNVKESGDINR